ncbi:hypothetical protein A6D98_06145 [Aliivibrio fischeri]|uniref:hypothetical protein n=1 Tax=Aliivibrio fischeri TaxID=668 RepID=UPI00080E54D6|nr:hypothetical protein [Aliivibrio fischeri]OCH05878.1 hypothetical protein A6E10_07375 [Aliivibrio fischeri]OCH27444.1 hypothetical protein A6E13_06770 [Aliivibrio fischeri]OCH62580.1 hypothetical protein A6D98_06145 [Aliivibrio fischeri]
MSWQQSPLTWPSSAQAIQSSSEGVTTQVAGVINQAADRLTSMTSDAAFSRNELSAEAEGLLHLRDELNQLLNQGTVLTVSPYQYGVGEKVELGRYLNANTAIKTLAAKLRDNADKHRPTGNLYCVAIMVNQSQLATFASVLNELTSVFCLPDWGQVARQATALTTNETDKRFQPVAIVQPRFKPTSNMNGAPVRELMKLQGAELATLESLCDDKSNVIEKLQALAVKREAKLNQISTKINALKNLKGSVWAMPLHGSTEAIATKLTQAELPSDHQYTVASLLLSHEPLTFFQELLC